MLSGVTLTAGGPLTAVAALFAYGEQGAWFDPSDFSTMFQDSAGTTPVTAVAQPVGLQLDKRLGAVRGSELVANGTFDTNLNGWTAVTPASANVGGGTQSLVSGAIRIINDATGQNFALSQYQLTGLTVGRSYEVTLTRIGGTGDASGPAYIGTGTSGGLVNDVLNNILASRFVFVATLTTLYLGLGTGIAAANASYDFDNVSCKEIPGNHRTQATAASRPTLRQDASGYYYLEYDGVDDSMATGSVDFSGTDKMTVWAGVHKASDAAAGIFVELSSTAANNGSFGIQAPNSGANYRFEAHGAGLISATDASTFAAPISNVLSVGMNLAGTATTVLTPRVNGAIPTLSAAGAGTGGNFTNNPLYFGRRNNASYPFNGREYQTIVRGAATNDSQIARVERFIASRMGVTL